MKTVLTEFLEYLDKYDIYPIETIKNEFLKKEKQQITEAYRKGHVDGYLDVMEENNPEKYYNETFK